MQNLLNPIITDLGSQRLNEAHFRGEQIYITDIAVGTGCNKKSSKAIALTKEVFRTKATGGELTGLKQKQFNFQIKIIEDHTEGRFDIHEIGFFLKTGELFAIISSPIEKISSKRMKIDLILDVDFTITGTLANKITASESPRHFSDSFLSGESIIKICTQKQFDLIFNKAYNPMGSDCNQLLFDKMGSCVIKKNTTVFLSPIQLSIDDDPTLRADDKHLQTNNGAMGGYGNEFNNTFNGRPAYILKNPLIFESNACIIGLNTNDTIIVKENADCNIVINGTEDTPVTGIKLSGWTFDGRGGVNGLGGTLIRSKNGGAFSLDFAQSCTLNCQIINHNTIGKGGGIFGTENSKYITAENISNNKASVEGSGIYGCNKGSFRLRDCNISSIFPNRAIINNSAILIDNIVTKLPEKKKQGKKDKALLTEKTLGKESYSNKEISNLLGTKQEIAGIVQICKMDEVVKHPRKIKVITPFILKKYLNKIEEKIGKKIKL